MLIDPSPMNPNIIGTNTTLAKTKRMLEISL